MTKPKTLRTRMAKDDLQFRPRDEEALQRILRFQIDKYEAGRLIELDAPGGVVIHVKKGRVLATTVDQAGQETLCVLRDAGSLLGLEAVSGMVLPYFLWTVTDTELAIAPASQARDWLRNNAHPTQALLRASLDALRTSLSEQMALHGTATARLARLMLTAVEGEADRKTAANLMLALPKNVVARMLHMRAETLSRVLRKLEQARAITTAPKLEVLDAERLREMLEARGSE